MLDFELAEIYGYTTSAFNQQVKRNDIKFPPDFRFLLTEEDLQNLLSQNVTASWGGDRRTELWAFTESGVYITYHKITTESDAGKKFKLYEIKPEPVLLTYNRAKKTLITIPMKYIGLNNCNTSERLIAFQDYLLVRIMGFKNRKMRENKIKYNTIYRDSGVDVPSDKSNRKRDRAFIKKQSPKAFLEPVS